MDTFIGTVMIFAGNFAPINWIMCQGQLLPIQQYAALFSIIGTTYGGDGRSNFAVPDLRGRVPVGIGQTPQTPNIAIGQQGGSATNILTTDQLPAHNHAATGTTASYASTDKGTSTSPENGYAASSPNGYSSTQNTQMAQGNLEITIGNTGSGQSINNMQPFLGMNYIMCINGVFPTRN